MSNAIIWWIRNDLRLADNPALNAAVENGQTVIPVYVSEPDGDDSWPWARGAASRCWLHGSLKRLAAQLEQAGSRLVIRSGEALTELKAAAAECDATAIYWNRSYEPHRIAIDTAVKAGLKEANLEARSFAGSVLLEPFAIQTKAGGPFKVFTPFWRAAQAIYQPHKLTDAPERLAAPGRWPASQQLEALELLPRLDWHVGMMSHWEPGEPGANQALAAFLGGPVEAYETGRDTPGVDNVSRLSPALHFGELHPARIMANALSAPSAGSGAGAFVRQLYWRDFAVHLLYHFPQTTSEPLNPRFERFPWRDAPGDLAAWQHGRTGYPFVDAGMRQLWATGWMHNRVRMNVASFLSKHLLIHWYEGARWFWDTLVDADLPNNTMGWQWVAGSGADAAPYFRIFNPFGQGERFDGDGRYIRRWVPELAKLPDKWIHRPFAAPLPVLEAAGVTLGVTYPKPIVDHATARQRALAAYEQVKGKQS